jgi:hypothetical protein
MTSAANISIANSSIKRKSIKPNSNKMKKRNRRPKLLLPQVIGVYPNSDGELGLVTADGLVDVGDEHWATEKLVDDLLYCLVKKEAEPKLVTIPCANNESSYCKSIDLSEQYESNNTLLYRKYIICAKRSASTYCNERPIIFVVNLADLPDRLKAELIDLQATKSNRTTLAYVLHSAVARIFAMASLRWFYESASQEIKVILQP